MAVSNFQGTNTLVAQAPIVDWQQLSGFQGRKYFDGREFFAHDVGEVRERAETLTRLFEQNVIPSQKGKPVFGTLFNRIFHWFDSEKESETAKRSFPHASKSSCVTGLVIGTFGSLLTQHPLPLLLGLSQCLPSAEAQQKVGSEFQVNNYTANNQQFPSVVSFPDGTFVVVWESDGQDGNRYGIFGQSFDKNGAKIGSEFQVSTSTNGDQSRPSVAGFTDGNFIVSWESNDGSSLGIFCQVCNGTGTKIGSEFQVNTYDSGDQHFSSIASLKDGNFVVIWDGAGPSEGWGVFGQLFNGTGTKIGSEFQVNTYTINNQRYSSVASLVNGNFFVSWQSETQDSGSTQGIYGQFFNERGSKVGSEFRINTYALDDQWSPVVASFNNSNVVVIWSSMWQDGDLNGVYGQLFQGNGNEIGREFQVHTKIRYDQRNPAVTSLDNGNFVVTWNSNNQDGSLWGVYGQLFDENVAKIGNEFQINTHTTDSQSNPSVASLNNGNFVVIWNSNLQDGSGFGIFGQIFHDNFTFTSSTSTTSTPHTTTTILPSSTTTSIAFISSRSSTIYRTTETRAIRSTTSTTNPITTDRILVASGSTSRIPSPSSNQTKVLLWLAFLFGGAACVASFLQAGYLFFKSRRQEEGSDSIELREKGSTATSEFGERRPEEEHYQRTPDHVHPL